MSYIKQGKYWVTKERHLLSSHICNRAGFNKKKNM